MVHKSHSSKLKGRRSKKLSRKVSPFPSPMVFPVVDSDHSHHKPNYGRHPHRHCKVNIKRHKSFSELPRRRGLRIRQSIDHSIKSHINRLAGYRYNSMLKSSDTCCPMGICSYNNYSAPCILPSYVRHPPNEASKRPSAPKTHKKNKTQKEINRTNDLDQDQAYTCSLDGDLKRLTESVKNFEKQRIEFLSSLAKMHAQVSNLRIPTAEQLRQQSENEIKKTERNKIKDELNYASVSPPQETNFASMKRGNTEYLKPKPKKYTLAAPSVKSPKLGNLKGNIMDNLSKLLMSTAQRPTNKADAVPGLNLSKIPGLQAGISGKGLQGGFMNLAQTFCSMTTGF